MTFAYRSLRAVPRVRLVSLSARSLCCVPQVVTIDYAKSMPRAFRNMPNDIILTMAVMGEQGARTERLIRDIMAVDEVEWDEANKKVNEMREAHRQGLWAVKLPYKIGLSLSVSAAVLSIPMVFDLSTVLSFNELYVTTDVPEERDLETPLEVGAWAWNWMEPPLGTISFALLCLQFARAQMQNMHIAPYTEYVTSKRAARLISLYPKYSPKVVEDFARGEVA